MRPLAANSNSFVVEIEQFVAPAARLEIDSTQLQSSIESALQHIPLHAKRINIAIVNDAQMSRLHAQHCDGDDSVTDVLTFPSISDGFEPTIEIAVCIDEAVRRANEFNHSADREILLYIIHGLLHCAGFDDHDEDHYRAMHAEEDRILELIGVGATFHRHHNEGQAL